MPVDTIAACYIRVSTEDQTEYSPEAQKRALEQYARQHGMKLPPTHIYIDAGISGRKAVTRPAFMAMIAAAAVNEGTAARPYVVQTITAGDGSTSHTAQQNRQVRFLTANTARQAAQVWSRAVEDHYRTGVSAVDKAISHAKTGTAQKGTGSNNRLLLGAMEEYSTAFFIVVEDLPSGNGIPSQIANTLAREVAAMA